MASTSRPPALHSSTEHQLAADISPVYQHANAARCRSADHCSSDNCSPGRSACHPGNAHRGQRSPHACLRADDGQRKPVALRPVNRTGYSAGDNGCAKKHSSQGDLLHDNLPFLEGHHLPPACATLDVDQHSAFGARPSRTARIFKMAIHSGVNSIPLRLAFCHPRASHIHV